MDLGESKQVVNVNKNLKEWMNDPNNVYIGRRGIVFIDGKRFPDQDSPYANPFKVGKDGTRDEVCDKYREYFKKKFDLVTVKKELAGKTLGCWCAPHRCHGHEILKLIFI